MPRYKIEEFTLRTHWYYVEAASKEEAERMYWDGKAGEPYIRDGVLQEELEITEED